MRKGTTAAEQERGLRAVHDVGMKTRASFIFNFPGERREDLQETLDFVTRNRSALDAFRPSETVMVPESDLALRPDHYHIEIERFGDGGPDGPPRDVVAGLPVKWRSRETSEDEMTLRQEWFVREMRLLMPETRRQFVPPTFPEIVQEALDGRRMFTIPEVQRPHWRKETEPGRHPQEVANAAERRILEALETSPHTLEQLAGLGDGDSAGARAALSYLMCIGFVQIAEDGWK